jgi:hypothetical protein
MNRLIDWYRYVLNLTALDYVVHLRENASKLTYECANHSLDFQKMRCKING